MAKTNITNIDGNGNGTSTSPFKVNAIRAALIAAHNDNNKKAIDIKLCKKLGIQEETLDSWVGRCESFRVYTLSPWVNTFFNESVDNETRKKLEDAIFPEWKEMLKTGEEDLLHKELRVDEYDLYLIFKFGTCSVPSDAGTQFAIKDKKLFRKGMETVLGLKMAMNAVLTEEEREVIPSYEKAQKTIKSKTEYLEGEKGAVAALENLKKQVEELQGEVTSLELISKQVETGSDASKYILSTLEGKEYKLSVITDTKNKLATQVGNARAALADAQTYVDINVGKYEVAMNKINRMK